VLTASFLWSFSCRRFRLSAFRVPKRFLAAPFAVAGPDGIGRSAPSGGLLLQFLWASASSANFQPALSLIRPQARRTSVSSFAGRVDRGRVYVLIL